MKEVSESEAIHRIEEVYHAHYDPNSGLDAWNQLLACEAIAEAIPVREYYYHERNKENVGVNGFANDSYKLKDNFDLTPGKLEIIEKLKKYNSSTRPPEIAKLLEELLSGYNTTSGWWLRVAQQWTPKAINSALNRMIKVHTFGQVTIRNPAKYFTYLIKFHPKRKTFRRINDTRK